MKNLIKQFIKTHEQKSKLDLISELLTIGTVEENIELFNKVKANFHYAMELERKRKENEINLINRIRPVREVDPNFNKKYEELETVFEIITPSTQQ